MRNPFVLGAGGVVSTDIAVPEHEREVEFYSKVLTTGDEPLWREDLMNNLGTPIIGLGERKPEYESLPLQWMPHFQVTDVAASAQRAIELGGTELMHGRNDDGVSLWAGFTDPVGAGFGIIPAVDDESYAAQMNERQGNVAWLSLFVPDASASQDFYQQVIGWKAKSAATANFEMLIDDETAAAEICQPSEELSDIPSVWLIHLPVGDLDESLRRVNDNGGEVIQVIGESKSAIIRDPVGVYFALMG